jgi:hypothetical protein
VESTLEKIEVLPDEKDHSRLSKGLLRGAHRNIQAMATEIYQIDPLTDPRWEKLVQQHPKASIFHTVNWLKCLQSTYGYEPVAYTTAPPNEELTNGVVFCRVQSWLTGHRLVSLPFSDHCEPLCDQSDRLVYFIQYLKSIRNLQHLRYLEVRPVHEQFQGPKEQGGFKPAAKFFIHIVNLRRNLDEIFCGFHKDCVQRRIRRADRAGLMEKTGRSEELLEAFYGLFVATRRRHHVPPIPYAWFRNLASYLGNGIQIRIAFKDKRPICAILTLRFRDTLYYKYGCSDVAYKRFGATPWLLWRALSEAKSNGANKFDLGRTEADNAGLLAFKGHWASESAPLLYWKFPEQSFIDSVGGWKLNMAKRVFSFMPNALLKFTGRVVYRHIG